jgi:tRNA U54 and U55 pseudouridine synthase Pus10
MGMFDTIYFDKAYTCQKCQGKIYSTQTKAFENLLEGFHVKDCVGHAEEMRIVKEELFCDNCSEFIGQLSRRYESGRRKLVG